MTILFPNALTDPQEYLQAQTVWRRLFDRIKCENYQGPVWTQWMGGTCANGTPFYDGSVAIYSQFCEKKHKGIKVWLFDPKERDGTDAEPASHFSAFVEPCDPYVARIDALDISCVLSDENLEKAESLIRLYMVDDLTPEEMVLLLEVRFPQKRDQDFKVNTIALASLSYGIRKHFGTLRGAAGNCMATYDATGSKGKRFNTRMSFSRPDGSKTGIVDVQAREQADDMHLSYRICGPGGDVLAKGPEAAIGLNSDAPDDVRIIEDWLDEIHQFAADNRSLIF